MNTNYRRGRTQSEPGEHHEYREHRERWRIGIEGIVQSVGFRPFIYRLAREHDLHGWVNNDLHSVTIKAEGTPEQLAEFRAQIERQKPADSLIRCIVVETILFGLCDHVSYE